MDYYTENLILRFWQLYYYLVKYIKKTVILGKYLNLPLTSD